MQRIIIALSLVALATAPMGCGKKDKTKNPDEAGDEQGDPLEALKNIPNEIQAEVDGVLKPITDVDVVIEQVTSIPSRHGIDAKGLKGMASASLQNGTVAVNIDVSAEAKAEIEQMLQTVTGIATGIKETPERAATATKNILALGVKATGLVGKLTAKYQAKLKSPVLKADEKAKIQADLDAVMKLDADIKGIIAEAKTTVTEVPQKGTEALAKLTAAFAG
jgi:hypothetical protein